jgi:tetratricopeptide (TPR) repeat protein
LAHTLVQNAREHIDADRVSEAIKQLVLGWERNFVVDLERIAEERRVSGDYAAVTEIYSHARRLYSDLGDRAAEAGILFKLGTAYREQKQTAAAHEQLQLALQQYQSQGDVAGLAHTHVELGKIALDNNDINASIEHFNLGLSQDPFYIDGFMSRAYAYNFLGRTTDALADFTHALELDPDFVDAYNDRGRTYAELKDYSSALADYTRALELDPNYVHAYNNRGNVYRNLKDYPAALADYTRALELDKNYTFAYGNRGLLYFDQRDYPAALADFTHALELDPDFVDAYNDRGRTYAELGDYTAALADYSRATELEQEIHRRGKPQK